MDSDLESAKREGLLERVRQLLERVAVPEARVAELAQENEQLRQQSGKRQPPHWLKANRPQWSEPKLPPRKRAREHDHGRRRETPFRIEYQTVDRCPECNCCLRGESVHYVRQVVEIPEPQPVPVVEHRVIKRYCPQCERWRSPKLDLAGQALGQGRMRVRVISLIAYLRNTLRLTIEAIHQYLETIHGLTIASGEMVELLHQLRPSQQSPSPILQSAILWTSRYS